MLWLRRQAPVVRLAVLVLEAALTSVLVSLVAGCGLPPSRPGRVNVSDLRIVEQRVVADGEDAFLVGRVENGGKEAIRNPTSVRVNVDYEYVTSQGERRIRSSSAMVNQEGLIWRPGDTRDFRIRVYRGIREGYDIAISYN